MQKTGIKYGVICGLVYIVFGLISLLMGSSAQTNPVVGALLGIAVVAATFFVIFYGIKEFRDSVNNGELTLGQGVKLGGLIALIAALMSVVFNLLYHYVIDPGYMDTMLEAMRESFEDRGMSDEQIDATMKWSTMMQKPAISAGFTIVWYSLWGFVKGLISGAILKKEAPPTI